MRNWNEKEKEKRNCARENRNKRIVKFVGTRKGLKKCKLKSRKNCKKK